MQTRSSEQKSIRETTRVATIKSKQKAMRNKKGNVASNTKRITSKNDVSQKFNIYEKWIAEAIFSQKTKEKEYVSFQKIKKYLLDYMDYGLYQVIPKRTKHALDELLGKKLIKSRKESYAFTTLGLINLAPKKIVRRNKLQRENKHKTIEIETASKKNLVTLSGRISRPVNFE